MENKTRADNTEILKEEIDLKEIFSAIWQGKYLIVSLGALIFNISNDL